MIPSPTMFLGVLLAVSVLWGSGATYYVKTLLEDRAEVQAALKQANDETTKQISINAELRADVAAEQRALSVLNQERTKDEIRFQKEIAKINAQRTRAGNLARQHPERYGVAATYGLLRGMRDVCRRGGGTKADCKIAAVQAPAPRSSDSGDGQLGDAGSVE